MTRTTYPTKDFHAEILSNSMAENTRLAYAKGWRSFTAYCKTEGIKPLKATPEEVADFLIQSAMQPIRQSSRYWRMGKTLSVSTVQVFMSAINWYYQDAGETSPTQHPHVKAVMKGLMRLHGKPPRRVKALREHHVIKMLEVCDAVSRDPARRLVGLRDAAILALGFAAALRRAELCALTTGDVEFVRRKQGNVVLFEKKMFVHIRKSKTDQAGKGHKVAVLDGKHIKPMTRLRLWLKESGITQGYLFQTLKRGNRLRGLPMHTSDVPRLVKHYGEAIGLNPRELAGHSLRAGFVTSAAAHGARLDKIMEITRHTNPATVMKYIRDADSFKDHAGEGFL